MLAYIDSSVIMRLVLGEPTRLQRWPDIDSHVTSVLARVECLRTMDRLRLLQVLDDRTLASCWRRLLELLDNIEAVRIGDEILRRAGAPFPTTIATLDGIHLATALAVRARRPALLTVATHDRQLGIAARALGFEVLGLDDDQP